MVKSLVSFLYTHGVNIMGLTATTWKASMVIPWDIVIVHHKTVQCFEKNEGQLSH